LAHWRYQYNKINEDQASKKATAEEKNSAIVLGEPQPALPCPPDAAVYVVSVDRSENLSTERLIGTRL
jgi:hypothetical protein